MAIQLDKCLICQTPTTTGPFCNQHIPKYGQSLGFVQNHTGYHLYVGSIPLSKVLLDILYGTRIIKWWLGTDALTLWYYPPGKSKVKVFLHRLKMRLLKHIIHYHWIHGEEIPMDFYHANYLPRHVQQVNHQIHDYTLTDKRTGLFTIGVYYPDNGNLTFLTWKYGLDIIRDIIFPYANKHHYTLEIYNGKGDISDFLSRIDCYIRPSRHDSSPRLIELCKIHNIPTWYHGYPYPNVEDRIPDLINFIDRKAKS